MITPEAFQKEIDRIIENAIREDVGTGDHSSLACIDPDSLGTAALLVKDEAIIAGVDFAKQLLHYVDPKLEVDVRIKDGSPVSYGDIALYINGKSQSILKAERVMLNSMQRMSAIATKTKEYVDAVAGTGTKILDTRKTTPGFRALEKLAVKIGGGENHRYALYDAIMLKDNHIDMSGGVSKAVSKTKEYLKQNNLDLPLIVEARSLKEIEAILQAGEVDRILIDNFNYADTRTAVALIGNRCKTESSGGINLETVRAYADCGVDFISVGALTHSVHNKDLSLNAV
ncbi:MAG TPA: carboxylating nicotinate-nucleotide diphosphorylase [Flavobacteriaceae bacterium]|nr:carboxylating nicotinate-nucleotide diphosphorylase [Flavobacteriaceae bacterium]